MNGETHRLTLKQSNFKIVITMSAELTPFPRESGTIYNGFFDTINPPPPPSLPPSPGRREQNKAGLNRNLQLSILSYLCSYLKL